MRGGHGRSWTFHGSSWVGHPRGKGGERGRGGRGRGLGVAWGEGGLQEGAARSSWLLGAAVLCPMREEEEEEREKKKKDGKEKKKWKKFQT
jgi:hypothetical protein